MKTQYANAVTQYENGTSLGGRIIKEGGLVVFPTETVYGLGANGLNSEAVLKIFAAKGRPADNPLILHIAKKSELKPLWSHVPDNARILADTFWPGPLTMIFNRSSIVPDEVTAGLDTVAVRMPLNKTARALINAAGVPIAAPSANLSGKPSPTTAEHVRQDMDGRVDLIIDGGPCKYGLESTVVSLIGRPTILRPGAVTKEMLEAVIGPVDVAHAVLSPLREGETAASPGMKYRHYAPSAPMTVVVGPVDKVTEKLQALYDQAKGEGKTVGFLVSEEVGASFPHKDMYIWGRHGDKEALANQLYTGLLSFDSDVVDIILAEGIDDEGLGLAIMNRMKKAAGGHVVIVG